MKCLHILKDHDNRVEDNRVFSLLFNGEHIISASLDSNKILIWNVETGNLIHKLTGFNSLQMRLSNHTLVTSSTESNLKIWSLNRDKCLLNYDMINNNNNSSIIKEENSICCFEFNQDFLVSYSLDGFIKLWSMKTFKFIRNLLKVNGGAVWELCIYKTKLFCVLGIILVFYIELYYKRFLIIFFF
jgi:WD40 repeat protein